MEVTTQLESVAFMSKMKILLILCATAIATVIIFFIAYFLNSPTVYSLETRNLVISEGSSVSEITHTLAEQRIVRSALFTQIMYKIYFGDAYINAGTYTIDKPLSTKDVLGVITSGDYISPSMKVTFPEGFQAKNFQNYVPFTLTSEMSDEVLKHEGYLFPDTYYVSPAVDFNSLIQTLQNHFFEKLSPYRAQIEKSGYTQEEVIILASIIEREAKTLESKKIVAGILRNRLSINMPLQTDATLDYILNKTSAELTSDDLLNDSPYNSYVHTGLPPTPISNPGIEAIEAVLNPTTTNYLYYLTGDDGEFYYARTFDEHKRNKALYLK